MKNQALLMSFTFSRTTTEQETDQFGIPLYLWSARQMETSGSEASSDWLCAAGIDPREVRVVTDFDATSFAAFDSRLDEEVTAEVQAAINFRDHGVPRHRPAAPAEAWSGMTVATTLDQIAANVRHAEGLAATAPVDVDTGVHRGKPPPGWAPHSWRDEVQATDSPSAGTVPCKCGGHSGKNGNSDYRKVAKNQSPGRSWRADHNASCKGKHPECVLMDSDASNHRSATHLKELLSHALYSTCTAESCADAEGMKKSKEIFVETALERALSHFEDNHEFCVGTDGEPPACVADPKPPTRLRNCTCPFEMAVLRAVIKERFTGDALDELIVIGVGVGSTALIEAFNSIDKWWTGKEEQYTATEYLFLSCLSDFQINERFLLRCHKKGWITGYRPWPELVTAAVEKELGLAPHSLLSKTALASFCKQIARRERKSTTAKVQTNKIKAAVAARVHASNKDALKERKAALAKATGAVKPSSAYKTGIADNAGKGRGKGMGKGKKTKVGAAPEKPKLPAKPRAVCKDGCGHDGHSSKKDMRCFFNVTLNKLWKWPKRHPYPPGYSLYGRGPPRGADPYRCHLALADAATTDSSPAAAAAPPTQTKTGGKKANGKKKKSAKRTADPMTPTRPSARSTSEPAGPTRASPRAQAAMTSKAALRWSPVKGNKQRREAKSN